MLSAVSHNTVSFESIEAIPPLFGTPDSDLFRGYSVRRTLVRGTPTKLQMVRVRRIFCSARKILKIRGTKRLYKTNK